ncbi:MAG: TonB-dependent receptor [Myxococcota bacterium]
MKMKMKINFIIAGTIWMAIPFGSSSIAAEPVIVPSGAGVLTVEADGRSHPVTIAPWPAGPGWSGSHTLTLTTAEDGFVTVIAEPGPSPWLGLVRDLLESVDAPAVWQVRLQPPDHGESCIELVDEQAQPISAEAQIRWERAEHSLLSSTDGEGMACRTLEQGSWTVTNVASMYLSRTVTIDVVAGQRTTERVSLVPEDVTELVVEGLTDAEALVRSAEAVTVVRTDKAQTQSADLGEVLARTQGVVVRRSGGLGSDVRFSLNGLTGDQVRFFVDGVPLELAGFPFGIANVPVDLAQRVEVYRGVVPVRLGSDALGGAVNLVSEGSATMSGGPVSYQGGSFDTHRAAAHGRLITNSGLRLGAYAFLDSAANDYTIDVQVPNEVGRPEPATVRRFHDRFLSTGAGLEVGVVERAWTDRLTVRGFAAKLRRDIQNNAVMTIPYGEPTSGVETVGGMVQYAHTPVDTVNIDSFVSYAHNARTFTDVSECVYDWFGRCLRERVVFGEITSPGTDQILFDHNIAGRLRVAWEPSPWHRVELSSTPTYFTRTGNNLLADPDEITGLDARSDATQWVNGIEHVAHNGTDAIENRLFVKHYGQWVFAEEILDGENPIERNRASHRFGVGDGLRLEVAKTLWLKTSYELATRLPTPSEVFGDGALVLANLDLVPERSHNVNLGATLRHTNSQTGRWFLDVQGFGRFTDDQIVLLGDGQRFSHFNVLGARSVGVETSASYATPGEWLTVSGNTTYLDFRNLSQEGPFSGFVGDRIPNRPWLTANGSLQLRARGASPDHQLTLDWYTRFVQAFLRGWESAGLSEFKQQVPSQLSHTVAITYAAPLNETRVTASAEVQNLFDAQLFDFFGVQRPGRAVFGKLTASR